MTGWSVSSKLIICFVMLFGALAPSNAANPPRLSIRLVVGLDLSMSNPLVADKAFALKLADRIADEILDLPLRAKVMIRTFGDNDSAANTLQIDEIISARNKPEVIAESVRLLVANVPDLAQAGQLKIQNTTNIIAFLQTMHEAIGECQTPTRFILLSDGLEDSEYARLRVPGVILPPVIIKPPLDKRFKCNELQILGLGQGLADYSDIVRLRDVWTKWAAGKDRPFKRFLGLNDW